MNDYPEVLSDCTMSNSFLSETIQVCVVSRDYKRTMEGFVKLGIGPWRVYHYKSAPGIRNTVFRGKDETFTMTLCLAWNGQMMWEIIEPLEGPNIYHEFLEAHGEGVHHVAFDGGDKPYDALIAEFEARGFPVTQSGLLKDVVRFHYFDTEKATGTTFETYDPRDRDLPEPDEWFPAPPPR